MRTIAAAAAVAMLATWSCTHAVARAQTATLPSPTILPPTTQHVPGAKIEALAKPQLRTVHIAGDVTLVPAFPVADQLLPLGTVSLVVHHAIASPVYVNVPVEVDVNGKFVRTIFVGYHVQHWVQTAVASHDLVPGTVLAATDLTMARVPQTGLRTNGVEALVGRRILGAVRGGAPVAIEQTQTDQIVKPGASVVLIVHDGGVSVVADVVARTGGGLGDQISVYNPQTNKMLSGTVIGPDRVELNLTGDTQ